MRQAILILLLLAGCASGTNDAPNITLNLEQEAVPNAFTFSGPVNLRFALSVVNTTKEAVKLNPVQIPTIGSSAPTIQPTSPPLNINPAPRPSPARPTAPCGPSPR